MERQPILQESVSVTIRVRALDPQYSDLLYNLPLAIRYHCVDGDDALTVKKGNPYLNAVGILINYALAIFLIVIGALHANECPAEKKIPAFVIVLGTIILIKCICNYQYDYKSVFFNEYRENPYADFEYDIPLTLAYLNLFFLIAEFAALITLCVFAFGAQPTTKPEDHNLPNYCNNDLYLSGFWVSVCGLIFYSFRCIRFCCVCPH